MEKQAIIRKNAKGNLNVWWDFEHTQVYANKVELVILFAAWLRVNEFNATKKVIEDFLYAYEHSNIFRVVINGKYLETYRVE